MLKIIITTIILIIFNTQYILAKPPIVVQTIEEGLELSNEIDSTLFVIFKSKNCNFCNILSNDIKNDSSIFEDKIICYVDINKNKKLVNEYGVKSIPDTRAFKNKKQIDKKIGYEKNEYKKWINNVDK
jgi:thioredoxin-related protein